MGIIKEDSLKTKERIISDILEKARQNDLQETFSVVRGSLYNTDNHHIVGLTNSQESSISLKAFINACKTNKDSRCEVNYLISSFVASTASIDLKEATKSMTEPESKLFIEESIKKMREGSLDKTLIIFVLSENEVEMIIYGLVESEFKSKTSIVISPEPIKSFKGDYHEFKESNSSSGTKMITNFFEMNDFEKKMFDEVGISYDGVFERDALVFPKRQKETSLEKKKKKKTKFGF